MIALGFGKFARADRIFALEPLLGDERGDGRRTRVWVEGIADPIIASRTEGTILRDMGQEQAVDATLVDEALDLASRLAKAADVGRVDLSDLGRRARRLLAATTSPDQPPLTRSPGGCSRDSAPSSSTSARRRCTCAPAATGRRYCCCTVTRGRPPPGTGWRPGSVAQGFRVVCPDLRGYGQSVGPPPAADHSAHSKRAVAGDLVRLMDHLGHPQFALAGHDRGSYVALRLALDHPARVSRLALLDCIPISEHLARMDARFATSWWHWFFFAQPDIPERVINADPDAWYRGDPEAMGWENHDEFRRATRNPAVVRAMLEDYRAGLTVDRADEEADRAAGPKDHCPAAAALVARRRSRGPLRRPAAHLGRLGGRRTRARHRLDPSHGRGGAGGPGCRAGRLLRQA